MKKALIFLFLLFLTCACSNNNNREISNSAGSEIIGSWVNNGTFYAGSSIIGTTTLIFKADKTLVALEKAKGMPTITEKGLWEVKGDTLKIKYAKSKPQRPDIVSYSERNGGKKDFLKPAAVDTLQQIAWNYKITGNKMILDGSINGYSGPNELLKN